MSMITARYFGANGWLISYGSLKILVDPWLIGDLTFGLSRNLFNAKNKSKNLLPKVVDIILLTQGLEDHSHPETLKIFPRTTKVVCSLSASKVVNKLGFINIKALKPGEEYKEYDLQIEATKGANVPNLENGYLITHRFGKIYIEPHGFLDKKVLGRKVDIAITPVIGLSLPIFGNFINGNNVIENILKGLRPKYILSSTTGGEIQFTGLLNSLISQRGTIQEAKEKMTKDTIFITPETGVEYKLEIN